MARDSGAEAGTVVLAFVLGAAVGAAVALLTAPAAGEETRRKIAARARDGADRAREVAGQGRDLWNRQRDTVASAIERGREAYQQARGTQAPRPPSAENL
jgi:gas vesicle protein